MESLQSLSERKVSISPPFLSAYSTLGAGHIAQYCFSALQKRLLLHEEAVRTNERVRNHISAHSDHSSTLLRALRG